MNALFNHFSGKNLQLYTLAMLPACLLLVIAISLLFQQQGRFSTQLSEQFLSDSSTAIRNTYSGLERFLKEVSDRNISRDLEDPVERQRLRARVESLRQQTEADFLLLEQSEDSRLLLSSREVFDTAATAAFCSGDESAVVVSQGRAALIARNTLRFSSGHRLTLCTGRLLEEYSLEAMRVKVSSDRYPEVMQGALLAEQDLMLGNNRVRVTLLEEVDASPVSGMGLEWLMTGFALTLLLSLWIGYKLAGLHRRESELLAEAKMTDQKLASIGDGVVSTDVYGKITALNAAAETLLGCMEQDAVGKAWDSVFTFFDGRSQHSANPVMACCQLGQVVCSKTGLQLRTQSSEIAINYLVSPIKSGGAMMGTIIVLHDVSREQALEQDLAFRQQYDNLTSVLNRDSFNSLLGQTLANQKAPTEEHHALVVLDLDRFAMINETSGHSAGDDILQQVVAALRARLGDQDHLGRLDGDQFAVLLAPLQVNKVPEQVEALRHEIERVSIEAKGLPYEITASFGVVCLSAEQSSGDALIAQAAALSRKARAEGGNQVLVAADHPASKNDIDPSWISVISEALEHERFMLYVQPIRAASSKAGVDEIWEVFIRLLSDRAEVIEAGRFLPSAEHHGMMPQIDRWVIRQVLEDSNLRFIRKGYIAEHARRMLSLNISTSSLLQNDFAGFIAQQIDTNAVVAEALCFEITQDAVTRYPARVEAFVAAMAELGCHVMIDDFSASASAFEQLKRLPIGFIKIDGRVVRQIADDAVDYSVVDAVNRIGHGMGLRTIAEFAETDAVVEKLREIGVDYIQGYAVANPFPLDELRLRLRHARPRLEAEV